MNRPRLFLSAVSEELRSARQAVATTVRILGFDPVSQDDFPTGYGELRQWLREQIDSCEGLIQLVGHGYGAEPPEADPGYGRVSYTQFGVPLCLYACRQGKKTWVIVVGDGCQRDKPPGRLDLPREADHPDPAGYQAERRQLQEDYLARLKRENHLRHTANNDTELQNIILRLRDELGELRQRWEEWLQKDAAFKDRAADQRGETLGLTEEEVAFYDALEVNDSAVRVLGDATLRTIAQELVRAVRHNVTIDWTLRENVRAQIRVMIKRILRNGLLTLLSSFWGHKFVSGNSVS
jgi:hypothetical protein